MRSRVLGALAIGLFAVMVLLVVVSDDAAAVGAQVRITGQNQTVLEGRSTLILVEFGIANQTAELHATCDDDLIEQPQDECPIWQKTVEYDESENSCFVRDGRRQCAVEFPQGWEDPDGGPSPVALGEPSHQRVYTVGVGEECQESQDQFEAHTATAFTCRDGFYRRGERLLVTTSGHAAGDTISVTIRDLDRGVTVLDRERTSSGPQFAYDFLWRPGLNYDLGGNQRNQIQVQIESNTKQETQTFPLEPGLAQARTLVAPGVRDQDLQYDRTESVLYAVVYDFPGRPPGCLSVPFADNLRVTEDMLDTDRLSARVNKVEDFGLGETKNFTDRTYADYLPAFGVFRFNYTIPRDAEATHNGSGNPLYEIQIQQTELANGNRIEETNTTDYRVDPYTIVPEFIELQDEVERLETAEVVVNLTYADGGGFTPNDTNEPVYIEFGLSDEEEPEYTLEMKHQRAGRWNASVDLGFEYEPLGEYVWRVQATEDIHGRPDEHNQITSRLSDIVDVVGARPLIDFATFVGDDRVNGSERTRTVHVTLNAEYKNGIPLTDENVDPSLGGVMLRVKKMNEFGREIAVDSMVMTSASDDGDWVRSFRLGRTDSAAPIGEWELEVVARDDRDPPNENETGFPFDVRPAQLDVSPLAQPPALVDGSGDGQVEYRIRLTYPDGTLLTERLLNPARGGELTVQLERIRGVGQDPAVDQTFNPRPVGGGQSWQVTIDSSKLVPGNHFFNVTGEDIYGNRIGPEASRLFTVLFNGEFRNSTTPICPAGNESGCDRERGSEIFAIFPGSEGDTGLTTPEPEIRVLRKIPGEARWITHKEDVRITPERFQNITGETVTEGHVGYFNTDESTPEGRYRLYIIGRAEDETGFAGYSEPFNITPIVVDRTVLDGFPATAEKGQTLTGTIELQSGDVFDRTFAEAGRVTSGDVQVTPTALGTFVRWTPSKTTPTGPATVHVEGRDVFGNPFEAELGPVEIQPLEVGVDIARPPPAEADRGSVMETQVEMTFPDGSTFRPVHGRPDVIVRDATGERVDTGSSLFSGGRWELNWRPPASIPEGRYIIEVTGRDSAGNLVETTQTRPFEVVPGRIPGDVTGAPADVNRGGTTTARFTFDTRLSEVNATVTTGSQELGTATTRISNDTAEVTFSTTRTTPLVQAFFQVRGSDEFGNELTARSPSFQIDPMRLQVRFVSQPAVEVPVEGVASGRFVIEYPDGSRLRAGQGSPIVGLFTQNQPRGLLDDVRPLEQDPTVWRVRWDPPDDIQRDVPFHFTVSALDRFQNEAPPTSSRGFFVTNPIVPDYLPTPGPGPWIVLGSVLAAAVLIGGRRVGRHG